MNASAVDPHAEATGDGIFGLSVEIENARVILIPVPFDATTSYRKGTAQGPEAILEASYQVDLHDTETGEPWRDGIAMLPIPAQLQARNQEASTLTKPVMEASGLGDHRASLERVNQIGDEVAAWVQAQAKRWYDRDKIVGVVGGDHASPLGCIEEVAKRWPGLGVLQVDAHADLRVAYQGFVHSHASIMHNVLERAPGVERIVQVGVRDLSSAEIARIRSSRRRIVTWFDRDIADRLMEGESFGSVATRIIEDLPAQVYISFDIDGLTPSLCPHTGTPVPGGLSFHQAGHLIKKLVESGREVVGFDLCEVAPGAPSDGLDAIVGARMLYKLSGWALRAQLSSDGDPA